MSFAKYLKRMQIIEITSETWSTRLSLWPKCHGQAKVKRKSHFREKAEIKTIFNKVAVLIKISRDMGVEK